jgi:acyl-CoA oxidase
MEKITTFLDDDNLETRAAWRQVLQEELFIPQFNIPLAEDREQAYKRLKRICDKKLISVYDFVHNPLRIFAGKLQNIIYV